MNDNLYECQRLLRQIQRDCAAINAGHDQAMMDIQRLYQPTPTQRPSAPQIPPPPTERRWKYLGEDGLIPHELSQKATRDPQLFTAILQEVQEAADQAKGQA